MTATPYFATRPTPPAAGTEEYERWKKDATLAFPGGYLKSAYGNLIQTFTMAKSTSCTGTDVSVSRKAHTRTNKIGGTSQQIAQTNFTYTKYPKRNGALAAGGEPITITTSVGSFTARMGGDMQDLAKWLCGDGASQLYDGIEITSPRGAHYGTFSPSSNP